MGEFSSGQFHGYLDQHLLIAMPGMLDPNFERSVTLMCQHSEEGAIGITINKLSKFTVGEVLEQLGIECRDRALSDAPVLQGGPVNTDRGFVLHTPMPGFESSLEISSEIMVTTSRDVLVAIAEGEGPEQFLVALGYAGWGDGQLESELRDHAWLSVPVDRAIVFDLPLKDRWQEAVSKLGVELHHLHGAGGSA
ncbi:MAG: YqgE/AlgH family protein [Xanthomonadales bacterium]|nr:YqgE/AlgH family protein [Xanthomonadales bacterium]NIN60357.1 YqgE/AlgH family protein [Xanthomonadales bacterium]NIN75709.1 YqgE/AlgH family protein [Xanthomonadales bacterium]NIO14782.1 YqgE/AlgH family protein [Xanthomonadales bacterium]NIP12750.1 YqgE/AlgH family protein [Xanthomonadales bacterium]